MGIKRVKRFREERGFILITLYLLLVVLLVYATALISQSFADLRGAQRFQASNQAFYLAEAGVDQAIAQLRQNFGWNAGLSNIPLGSTGNYSVQVGSLSGGRLLLSAQGNSTLFATPVQRSLQVTVQQSIPSDFFDNVIWASQSLVFNGNSYSVTGDVRYGESTPPSNLSHVNGTVTYDPTANPLPRLSFQQLYNIAQSQGNVYDANRIGNGHNVFPTSFWYKPPTDPNDPTTGVPNVNYITTDLILNGNIGTIGGFFVVAGNVLTDPNATNDTTINGNGQVAGAIYTTGDFRINGGGNGLNINGGVWAGDEAQLNGGATLTYNSSYMKAIQALKINPDVQVTSWSEAS